MKKILLGLLFIMTASAHSVENKECTLFIDSSDKGEEQEMRAVSQKYSIVNNEQDAKYKLFVEQTCNQEQTRCEVRMEIAEKMSGEIVDTSVEKSSLWRSFMPEPKEGLHKFGLIQQSAFVNAYEGLEGCL